MNFATMLEPETTVISPVSRCLWYQSELLYLGFCNKRLSLHLSRFFLVGWQVQEETKMPGGSPSLGMSEITATQGRLTLSSFHLLSTCLCRAPVSTEGMTWVGEWCQPSLCHCETGVNTQHSSAVETMLGGARCTGGRGPRRRWLCAQRRMRGNFVVEELEEGAGVRNGMFCRPWSREQIWPLRIKTKAGAAARRPPPFQESMGSPAEPLGGFQALCTALPPGDCCRFLWLSLAEGNKQG